MEVTVISGVSLGSSSPQHISCSTRISSLQCVNINEWHIFGICRSSFILLLVINYPPVDPPPEACPPCRRRPWIGKTHRDTSLSLFVCSERGLLPSSLYSPLPPPFHVIQHTFSCSYSNRCPLNGRHAEEEWKEKERPELDSGSQPKAPHAKELSWAEQTAIQRFCDQ